ncbi:MAG: PAS domain-containing protein [Sulfurimonas sp.]|nr:PAS domain-containing protein [Sulfurimonas sp.]
MSYAMKNVEWRRMFDSALDPFFMHDKDFRLILANRAYFEFAGITEKEAIGKPYWEVFPKGSGPMKSCLEAMNMQGGRGGERRNFVCPTGKCFFLEVLP